MNTSAVIELVIGVVFVYILMSILVQQINTIIAYVWNLRARHLRYGLEHLITDEVVRLKVLGHPLIGMIQYSIPSDQQMTAQQAEQAMERGQTTHREWIDEETFVEALTNVLAANIEPQDFYAPLRTAVEALPPSTTKSAIRGVLHDLTGYRTNLPELRTAIDSLTDEAARTAVLTALDTVENNIQALGFEPNDLATLIQGINQVQDPKFQDVLEAVIAPANNLPEARERLKGWFETSMARLTEAYTRQMTLLTIVVGAGLVILLNVDSLHLAESLWSNSALRAAIVSTAQTRVEGDLSGIQVTPTQSFTQPTPTPLDGAVISVTPTPESNAARLGQVISSGQNVATQVNALLELNLPIGWHLDEYPTEEEAAALAELGTLIDPQNDPRNIRNLLNFSNPDYFGFLIRKIIGILITIIAVSQGAPFWFNIINRIIRR